MPKQERSARTRQALILSAAQSFARCGYVTTSLSSVSKDAGVSSGALYFHFENKAAMADAVVASATRALCRAARLAQVGQTHPLQALVDVTHALASLVRLDVLVQAGLRLSGDSACPTRNINQDWQRFVRAQLDRAADQHTLATRITPGDAAVTITALTTGLLTIGQYDAAWLSRPVLTTLWRVLLPQLATGDGLARLEPAATTAVIDRSVAGALRLHGLSVTDSMLSVRPTR